MSRETRIAFVSLGCAKNLVDSEKMLGQLAEAGCALTNEADGADVVVINTCGFLAASRDEAVGAIREMVDLKNQGRLGRVVVAGCLVQRDGEKLLDAAPGIDALVGVNNRDDIVRAALAGRVSLVRSRRTSGLLEAGSRGIPSPGSRADRNPRKGATEKGFSVERTPHSPDLFLGDYHPFVALDTGRLRLTPRHYAYLRVSEGCNQKCTFCTIPSIRGPMHCKPPGVILEEARELVADGAVEISLIGQDTTSYGEDIGYSPGLAGLLRELNHVDGLHWLRLMYVYPSVFTDAMIDAIAECDRVVKYIDMPLQHINDRVLKAMHRRVNRAQTEALLGRIRERIPGVSIRTTMIAGFPGETEAEFEELVEFVREFEFDALGVFPYSLEPETPSGRMREQLAGPVKAERVERLMLAQQQAAFARADRWRGRRFEVLVEGPKEKGLQPARHAGQAPEVDSVTLIKSEAFSPGQFIEVRCTGRRDYDLTAVPTRVALPTLS